MNRWQRGFLLTFSLMYCSAIQAVDIGGIKGEIDFCEQGGMDGLLVYIPGRQYSVVTNKSGQFSFEFVPAGKYVINFRYNQQHLFSSSGVLVNNKVTTEMGVITVCDETIKSVLNSIQATSSQASTNASTTAADTVQAKVDMDNDGSPLSQDCNDNDPAVRPGAIEVCDGKDNNCNGSVDESTDYVILNGIGTCSAGKVTVKKCTDGYADCDTDPSNGCEINTDTDSDNCGVCGNACSSLDICAQGIC